MKNLSKILALTLVMMMCISLLPIRSLAATNEIFDPDKWKDPPNDPTEPDIEQEPIENIKWNGNIYKVKEEKPKEEELKEEELKEEELKEEKEEVKEEKPEVKEADERILKMILTVVCKDLEKYINGDKTIIEMDIAPYIKDGRTMIPIRYLAEALEMKVSWDAKTRTVFLEDDNFKIEIPVDTNKIIVNGEERESDVMPEIKSGRTMLPIANIARALGLRDGENIFWDPVEKKATIIRKLQNK